MEVEIRAVAAGGEGIGRLPDGRVVFCEGALPGERVEIEVTEERKDYARAAVTDVTSASAHRVAPPCPHRARGCGGCTWQHVDAGGAREMKADIVRDALRRIAKLPAVTVVSGAAVPLHGYRTSARVAADPDGRAAYHRHRSRDLVPVDSCLVTHPRLEELIATGRFPGADGVVLRVSAATGERLAWVQGRRARTPDVPAGTAVWRGNGRPPTVNEEAAGRRWRISAASFFQSGPDAASTLVDAVARAAGEPGPIVDLYAGVGLLGGALAGRWGVGLTAVEADAAAVSDARHNLAGLDAVVEPSDVAAWQPRQTRPHVVIADPARPGLGPSAAASTAALGAPTIVLVSCDPASLGRDAALLAGHGYELESVEVLDLFPGTPHVEAVSRFRASG